MPKLTKSQLDNAQNYLIFRALRLIATGGVPVKVRNKPERNETDRIEMKQIETKRNKPK